MLKSKTIQGLPLASGSQPQDFTVISRGGKHCKTPVSASAPVRSVAGKTGAVLLVAEDVSGALGQSHLDADDPHPQYVTAAETSPVRSVRGIASPATNGIGYLGHVVLSTEDIGLEKVDNVKQIPLSASGVPNGVATLNASGKLPDSQIPELAKISTFEVTGSNELVTLDSSGAQQGDIAIDTVGKETWILTINPASTPENWKKIKVQQNLESSDFTSQGTSGTILHGSDPNGTNTPYFGKVINDDIELGTITIQKMADISSRSVLGNSEVVEGSVTLVSLQGSGSQVLTNDSITATNVTLRTVDISGGNIKTSNLVSTSITGNLYNSTVSGCTIRNAVIQNSSLSGVSISGATLQTPTINGVVTLTDAILVNPTLMDDSNIYSPTISGGVLLDVSISGASISGATLTAPVLVSPTLNNITTSGGTFSSPSILSQSSVSGTFEYPIINFALIQVPTMSSVNITSGTISSVDIINSTFTNPILPIVTSSQSSAVQKYTLSASGLVFQGPSGSPLSSFALSGITTAGVSSASITGTNAKFGGTSHYTSFDGSGGMLAVSGARKWNDINIPLGTLRAGVSVPDFLQIGTTGLFCVSFNETAHIVYGNMEILHDYAEGTDIHPHLHWAPSTAGTGNVRFNLTYSWLESGESVSGSTMVSGVAAASGVAHRPQYIMFPAISGPNKKMGSRFIYKLERVAAPATAYTSPVWAFDFGIHYQIDTLGSTTIGTK